MELAIRYVADLLKSKDTEFFIVSARLVGTYIIGYVVDINSCLGVSLDDARVGLYHEKEWLCCPDFEDDIFGGRIVTDFELGDQFARRECDLCLWFQRYKFAYIC